MAGRPPDDLANQSAADTFTLTTHQLAGKYGIAESIVRDWRLHCKRKPELAVGYGTGRSTGHQPVISGVTADDELDPEELWAVAFKAQDRTTKRANRRANQVIELPNEPVGIAYLSDLHFGGAETDYRSSQPVPYSLGVTVEKTHWVAAPISLRGTDNVLVRLTGSAVQTDSSDPVTVVLTNETTAY